MALVLKNGIAVEDNWSIIDTCDEPVPNDFYVLPVAMWQHQFETHGPSDGSHGFWINSDEDISAFPAIQCSEALKAESIIAIKFANFTDGRGFSTARLLRERYHYQGELRAFGHIIRDQLFMLQRCGFDTFVLPEHDNLQSASSALNDFTNAYQVAVDQPLPLFRRRDLN